MAQNMGVVQTSIVILDNLKVEVENLDPLETTAVTKEGINEIVYPKPKVEVNVYLKDNIIDA